MPLRAGALPLPPGGQAGYRARPTWGVAGSPERWARSGRRTPRRRRCSASGRDRWRWARSAQPTPRASVRCGQPGAALARPSARALDRAPRRALRPPRGAAPLVRRSPRLPPRCRPPRAFPRPPRRPRRDRLRVLHALRPGRPGSHPLPRDAAVPDRRSHPVRRRAGRRRRRLGRAPRRRLRGARRRRRRSDRPSNRAPGARRAYSPALASSRSISRTVSTSSPIIPFIDWILRTTTSAICSSIVPSA